MKFERIWPKDPETVRIEKPIHRPNSGVGVVLWVKRGTYPVIKKWGRGSKTKYLIDLYHSITDYQMPTENPEQLSRILTVVSQLEIKVPKTRD